MPVKILTSLLLWLPAFAMAGEPLQLAKLSATNAPYQQASPAVVDAVTSVIKNLDKRLQLYPKDHEAELLKAMVYFKSGKLDTALATLNALIKKVPDFQLAYLLKGDILLSRLGLAARHDVSGLVTSVFPKLDKEKKQQLALLREEAELRIRALAKGQRENRWPRQILALGESVKKALLVDKKANRLYVFSRKDNGELVEDVTDYYISYGKLVGDKTLKGDLRTPEGVYFVTSWISPDKLPSKYGVGAFPVNYPNELDKRNGKTGYGIWLHGTDKGYYSRPPRDSEGCVVLTNIDLNTLKRHIKPGVTPVVITESVEWVDYKSWQQERQSILQAVENWRRDWESMDVNKYLSHYETGFWSTSHNYKSWAARKKYLAKNKTFQKVNFSELSVLVYPRDTEKKQVAVVRLRQDYRSNNFNGEMYKRLYLSRHEDRWKIMYEGR